MTKQILISVVTGILCGYFLMPQTICSVDVSGALSGAVSIGLCAMLFLVGIDMGYEGTVFSSIKEAGLRVLVIPFSSAAGTLAAAALISVLLPVTVTQALAVGAGFGWYSLAPAIIMEKSDYLGTFSFMHNVMREIIAIILIPVVARKAGYIESAALPGAAAMDTCLPIIERQTGSDMVVYSFITGVVLSILVPVLVPVFISL